MHLETLHKALPPLLRQGNQSWKNTTKHIEKGTDACAMNAGKSPDKPEQIGKLTNTETLNGENQLPVCTHVYLRRTHPQLTVVI